MLPPQPLHNLENWKKKNKKTVKNNNNNIKRQLNQNKTTKTRASEITKTNKQIIKQRNKQIKKNNKPSTVVPELVTLESSLTHVLQAPNTQPYHSWLLIDWVICEVINPQRPDRDWKAPLAMLLMKTRVLQGCEFLKTEWANSIPLPGLG